jgi:hypothetical protein
MINLKGWEIKAEICKGSEKTRKRIAQNAWFCVEADTLCFTAIWAMYSFSDK